ncbi:leucine-rich repeat-containing protein 43 isoform X3 [Heterocephalus glaber]|nr:leucine-rich repeat-containing protein 43 isoform X3 [Heterocephalus glaber]
MVSLPIPHSTVQTKVTRCADTARAGDSDEPRESHAGKGVLSWSLKNRSRFLPPTRRAWKKLVPGEEAAVGPGEELVEALLDLVRSPQSLWALPEDSSAEDRFLRELAIQSPLMIRDTFFYSYFRSLRVVGKQVSQVGGDLLKFLKLEELVLSANRIKEVDAANLPPMLKVLELYGNELSSTECLCAHPPPGLQHLGLGQNQLRSPSESRYLTASHWPNLVSLDLGFNDLTDLRAMVAALRSLGRLRLLVLQGNPLALLPHYRGFTVDSLARLCVLDDVTVSPHERHQFRGLGQQGDLLPQDAQLVVTVGNIRGVVDSSVLDPEPGPKGPFVAYSYYVTYDFLGGEDGEASEHGGVLAEVVKPRSSAQLLGEELAEDLAEESLASVETTEQKSESSVVSGCSAARPPFSASGEELGKLRPRMDPRLCPSPGTVPFSTDHKPWANVIACNYEAQHSIRDLGLLKGFLLAGTTVTIMEEKAATCLQILSWPVVTPPVDSPQGAKKGKGEDDKKKKEKDRKDWKGKAEEPPQERKASHKKREAPKELCQDPPTLQALGSGLVALEPLLAGEAVVSTVCNFGVIRTPESDRLTFARDSKIKKGAKKEKTKSAAPIFESDYQPEQLTVEVEIQLGQVRSVEEALRAVANQARAE